MTRSGKGKIGRFETDRLRPIRFVPNGLDFGVEIRKTGFSDAKRLGKKMRGNL